MDVNAYYVFIVQSYETEWLKQLYIMRALLLKLINQDRQENQINKTTVERLQQINDRSQHHPIVLLSFKKPIKIVGRQSIKETFQNDKKVHYFVRQQYHHCKTDPSENRHENQQQDIFKLNLRNLISKSTPYLTGKPKYSPSTPTKNMQKVFRINKQIQTSLKGQIAASKQDYIKTDQYQFLPKSKIQKKVTNNNYGFRSRKNKVTFYMNNFMKTKYSKSRRISMDSDCNKGKHHQQNKNMQKSGFYPWDRSMDSQQDVQIPS